MKTLKYFAVFLLLALTLFTNTQAQTPTELKVKLGAFPLWSFTNIDSAVSQTASAYDCSLFKANTMYYTFLYDGGSNDSVQVIIMGKLTNTTSETIYDFPIDTVFAKSDVAYNFATSWTGAFDWVYPKVIPYNMAAGANDGDVTNDGTLRFAIIGTQNANLNTVRSWWNNR